jgi:hypothetical protein
MRGSDETGRGPVFAVIGDGRDLERGARISTSRDAELSAMQRLANGGEAAARHAITD